jgi:hypothetical protein
MTSCSDQGMMNTSLVDPITVNDIMANSVNRSSPKMSSEAEDATNVSISVVYTGSLDDILLDESSTLYKAINTYHLKLDAPFEINEEIKGINLSSYIEMEDPISIGKQISNGESILMVEIKNSSKNEI